MSMILQSVLAIFAAVGFGVTIYTLYELVCARVLRFHGTAELTLYGDGWQPASEQQLLTALYVRKHYLPDLSITFVELGNGADGPGLSIPPNPSGISNPSGTASVSAPPTGPGRPGGSRGQGLNVVKELAARQNIVYLE